MSESDAPSEPEASQGVMDRIGGAVLSGVDKGVEVRWPAAKARAACRPLHSGVSTGPSVEPSSLSTGRSVAR